MKSFAAFLLFLFNKNMRVAAMRRTSGSRGRFFAGQGNEGRTWKAIGPRRALLCEELPHNAQPCGISGWGVYGAFGDTAPAFEVGRRRGQARWNYV